MILTTTTTIKNNYNNKSWGVYGNTSKTVKLSIWTVSAYSHSRLSAVTYSQ